MTAPIFVLMIYFALMQAPVPAVIDGDGDGLSDRFEQELLSRFSPRFLLSAGECDGLPAEFLPGLAQPQVKAKNGTIYGQVSKADLPAREGVYLEIHYYHLWDRDCGPLNGHPLDVEHVSALLRAAAPVESTDVWKAEYWYAAAHEETVCDASHAVRSSVIDAEGQGPAVWISRGKHASYLGRQICRGGCGSDNCETMRPLVVPKLINLGERTAPLNGSDWIGWAGWPLSEKMQTDFSEAVLSKLDSGGAALIPVNDSRVPIKLAVLVGGSTSGFLVNADQKTGRALTAADGAVQQSLEKSAVGTGNALKRGAKGFWKAVRFLVPGTGK